MHDLHDYKGQLAVEAVGLVVEYGAGGRSEVQRGEPRRVLLDSLPAVAVRRGHEVGGVRAPDPGRPEVAFAVGTNLLAGADGPWSRVRPLLSDAVPGYVRTSFVETHPFETPGTRPARTRSGSGRCTRPCRAPILAHHEIGRNLHASVVPVEP